VPRAGRPTVRQVHLFQVAVPFQNFDMDQLARPLRTPKGDGPAAPSTMHGLMLALALTLLPLSELAHRNVAISYQYASDRA
jgi:hypothetical protein